MTDDRPSPIDFAPAKAVADAVLYEGYLLYPYRESSAKNRIPWQFGVLPPPAWVEARGAVVEGVAGSTEWWWNRTECLCEAPDDATVDVLVRALVPQPPSPPTSDTRTVSRRAVPVEVHARFALGDLTGGGHTVAVPLYPGNVDVAVTVRADRLAVPFTVHRLIVGVENRTTDVDAASDRRATLCRSLVGTHLVLGLTEGSFLSLLDPPQWAAGTAATCRNVRTFPVLAGPPGTSHVVLSSPILLPDHPEVAPESPGPLFDATEIDEILSLRALTLTDAEKAEACATDPWAAEIVERIDAMPREVWARLHGAVRSLHRVPRADAEHPQPDGAQRDGAGEVPPLVVAGVTIDVGSRVRLRPRRRGSDAQDMFIAGRVATVTAVLTDVDGTRFIAVAVDDDPRVAIAAGPGQARHFTEDEVEPLAPTLRAEA